MKIGPKLQELRSALEHSPGLLLVREKASLLAFREEWDFVVRQRIPVLSAERFRVAAPGEEPPRVDFELPARELVQLRQVTLWPGTGLVSTRNGTLITDSAFSAERLQLLLRGRPFNRFQVIKAGDTPCTIIECGARPGDPHHWLLETLPRLWALHRPEVRVLGPVTLFLGQGVPLAKEELIRALVPPAVELRRVPERSRIESQRLLLLPFFSAERLGYLPADCLEFLRSALLDSFGIPRNVKPTRKLFLSSRKAQRRKIVNDEALARELAAQGFEVVVLEDLSFGAQAALFNEAEVVVAAHGSGLANLVYARGCRVVEVFPGAPVPTYRVLAAVCGHRYACIPGDSYDKEANIVVRAEELLARLEALAETGPCAVESLGPA